MSGVSFVSALRASPVKGLGFQQDYFAYTLEGLPLDGFL